MELGRACEQWVITVPQGEKMKSLLKILATSLILLFVFSSAISQPCKADSAEQTLKGICQSFLANVVGVDLTKYNITSTYGVQYTPTFGGKVKEEGLHFGLELGQSEVSASFEFYNGVMVHCGWGSTPWGSTIYTQMPPANLVDATKNFLQKYETFVTQTYSRDTTYLRQALTCLDGVNAQTSTDKVIGNMDLKVKPHGNMTYFLWTYTQNNVNTTFKNIELSFGYGNLCGFRDSWSLYSVSNATPISEADAEPLAWAAAQNYNLTLASFQGSNMIPIKAYPDWSNMTYTADLQMARGVSFNLANPDLPDLNVPPSNTIRDPLTLYPFWHFIFYFSEPIGDTVGVEVGVWADTKEIDYCHAYGYLGLLPPIAPSQPANGQSSNGTEQNGAFQLQPEYAYAIILGVAAAIVIGSCLIIRKRKQQ